MLRVRNGNVSIGRGETGFLRVSAIRSDGTPYVLPPLPRDSNFKQLKAYLRLGINTDTYVNDELVDTYCDLTEPMKCTILGVLPLDQSTEYPIGTFIDNPGIVKIAENIDGQSVTRTYNKGYACFETEEIIDKNIGELTPQLSTNQVYHDAEKDLYWCAMHVGNVTLAVTYEFNISIALTNTLLQRLPAQSYVYDICVLIYLIGTNGELSDMQYKQIIIPRHSWTIEENTHGYN